ncbi:MAG TPA: SRPBCC family protein [Candidatus Binatia bacterium]|nr:SRPBCC family protein [Candidatus Binatia bacterium]
MLVRLARVGLAALGALALLELVLERLVGWRSLPPLRTSIVVEAPPERVWAILADVEGQPTWMTDLRSVRIETPGPVGVGTRAVGTVRIAGITVQDPVEVTAFDAPARFAVEHLGLFRGHGVFTVEPLGDGAARVVWEEVLQAPLFPRAWWLSARPILGRVFAADLGRLRAIAEAAPESSTGTQPGATAGG